MRSQNSVDAKFYSFKTMNGNGSKLMSYEFGTNIDVIDEDNIPRKLSLKDNNTIALVEEGHFDLEFKMSSHIVYKTKGQQKITFESRKTGEDNANSAANVFMEKNKIKKLVVIEDEKKN